MLKHKKPKEQFLANTHENAQHALLRYDETAEHCELRKELILE